MMTDVMLLDTANNTAAGWIINSIEMNYQHSRSYLKRLGDLSLHLIEPAGTEVDSLQEKKLRFCRNWQIWKS